MFFEPKIYSNISSGSVEVICGSMFSGKTQELIQRLKRLKVAKKKFIVFKPAIDIRYDKNKIVSHNKDCIKATAVNNIAEIKNLISDEEVIAIDEAQFFDETLISLCNDLADKGKRIIICGLDMDYLGVPFGIMPSLMAISDRITKLHAICSDCGDTANYSYRKSIDQDRVVIGEKDEYKALCRVCFSKKKNCE
tara:strand:- start:192 stop:773 length:582 start_codon:yes stop_codon:yes gene_type:complete